jgi:Holliday junction resolvase
MSLFPLQPELPEREFQKLLEKRLTEEGWAWQHIYRMKTASGQWRTSTTAVGWPDLVAIKGEYIIAIEVKGKAGRLEPAQVPWLERFAGIPTGRSWLLDSVRTDWQDIANWLAQPETAPRRHGYSPETGRRANVSDYGSPAADRPPQEASE